MLIYFSANTYRYLFFETGTENLQCSSTSSTMQGDSARQRGNGKVLDLQRSKLVNHNGAKMVYVWNVNKHAARTKMEVSKLQTKVTQ